MWDTGLPFWGLFITLALAAVYVIPVGTVYAVANLNSNVLTVLGEILSGYIFKGRPLVLLIFKVCTRNDSLTQSTNQHRKVLCIYRAQSGHVLRGRYEGMLYGLCLDAGANMPSLDYT